MRRRPSDSHRAPRKETGIERLLASVALIALAVNPGMLQGAADQRNFLLLGLTVLSPAVLFLRSARVMIPRIDLPLIAAALCMTAGTLAFHPSTFRPEGALFTLGNIFYFMMTARLVRAAKPDASWFRALVRFIIIAYFAVLVIQQACVLFGLPVFMEGLHYKNPWKLNALSAEPSHTSLILSVLAFFYSLSEAAGRDATLWRELRGHPLMWAAYSWVLFSVPNTTAFVLGWWCLLPWFAKALSRGSRKMRWIALAAASAVTAALALWPSAPLQPIGRMQGLIKGFLTAKGDFMVTDLSTADRIMPTLHGFRMLCENPGALLTGHGADADERDLPLMRCNPVRSAGVFALCYNYGLVCAFCYWLLIVECCASRRRPLTWLAAGLGIIMSSGFNLYIFWFIPAFGMAFKTAVSGNRRLLSAFSFRKKGGDGMESDRPLRVAVVGCQGIPAKYGGFETLVDNIVRCSDRREVTYTVYCSRPDMDATLSRRHGARLRYIPLRANGVMSIPYDILSMCGAAFGHDAVLVLGVSGCVWLPVMKLISRAKTIVNIDGLEYRREKWSGPARRFLKKSLDMAVEWADTIVSDNRGIHSFVCTHYGRTPLLIAYGGDHAKRNVSRKRQNGIIRFYGLEPGRYDLSVCRIEPENNCHLTLEAYEGTGREIVMVGNWQHSDYSRQLFMKYKGRPGYRLLQSVYDLDILYALRTNARYYVHGHRAGGTNPSLVEAMFAGRPVLAFDVVYNRETTRGLAEYFKDAGELRRLITADALDGRGCAEVAAREYTWSRIAAEYTGAFR